MKKLFITLIIIFFTHLGFAQSYSIIGAWHWNDSTNATSLFFDQEGGVSMHTGLKNEAILEKHIKKGRYDLRNGILRITWARNDVQKSGIRFIDNNSFEITLNEKQKHTPKRSFIFKRVVDEEVIEEKVQ